MAEFDAKQVTTFEWLGIGAGALAFINSFLPWLSVDIGVGFGSVSTNAWGAGFFGFASVLVLIAAAVIVLLPHFGVSGIKREQAPLIWLGLAAAGLLFALLAWLVNSGYGIGPSFGLFVGLILAAASGAGAWLTYKQAPSTNKAA